MGATIDGIYWDYGPDDEIEHFDRSQSYYITKYRPIDMENGLDFKVDKFVEDAKRYNSTGKYCDSKKGTKAYTTFWMDRYDRCSNGFEHSGYRISGDYYYFLNFYRMISAKQDAEVSDDGEAFPSFTNVQYEWFHYVEMCEKLGLDCLALKPRGVNSCPR